QALWPAKRPHTTNALLRTISNTLRAATAFSPLIVFLIVASMTSSGALLAQPPEINDPTAESSEIRSQLDAIRGVEEMQQLKQQILTLTKQNQQLMKQLLEASKRSDAMQSEMNALRERQADDARRRSSIPELQLVSQVRTRSGKRADISAGDRSYRILDKRPFRLALPNNDFVIANPRFMDDGTIEVTIADLDISQLLVFRPRPIAPKKKSSGTTPTTPRR
ncbi:MAG: hypothetical protein AAFN70_07110, partial [Planctomycetota bacterium]